MPSPNVVAASTLFVMALSERTDALSIQRDRYERVAQSRNQFKDSLIPVLLNTGEGMMARTNNRK